MTLSKTNVRRAGVTAAAAALLGSTLTLTAAQAAQPAAAATGQSLRAVVREHLGSPDRLSSGLKTWLSGPPAASAASAALRAAATPTLGSNVDANDPALDAASGQSETAIAAQVRGTSSAVLAAWNDISGFLGDATTRSGSITGVGLSVDGGRHFRDLIGLPNNNVDQQWSGDPSIAALGDGRHFAISSLYYPSAQACQDGRPAYGTVAVSIATVGATGTGATFTTPIKVALPGDLCTLFSSKQAAELGVLDKDWVSYDSSSRTLAVSYTHFFFPPEPICDQNGCVFPAGHSGNGQIEIVRAKVPSTATNLTAAAFSKPVVVRHEEPFCPVGTPSSEAARCGALNQGAYVAVAPGGDTYVAWERNIFSNLFGSGDPRVYLHAALVPAGATSTSVGGGTRPVVLTTGQPHATAAGGVKSMDTVAISGYSRGLGQDFPRVAINRHNRTVVFVWNDASAHPLGDIWMRTAPFGMTRLNSTARVNDDSSYALHVLPAVSVRSDGTICSSWYDRRLGGADSTRTDYYADCRASATQNVGDQRITTGSTDWAGTSSLISPNFGDYTDNASDGTHTFFTWTDGRLGIPQPFTDRR